MANIPKFKTIAGGWAWVNPHQVRYVEHADGLTWIVLGDATQVKVQDDVDVVIKVLSAWLEGRQQDL